MSTPARNAAADPGVRVDDEGYLVDPSDWTEAIAEDFAGAEGIVLTDLHWRVLHFVREFQLAHQVTPDVRFVIRFLAAEAGLGTGARARLFELFPYGYVKQACRIAGMRRPLAWSTG